MTNRSGREVTDRAAAPVIEVSGISKEYPGRPPVPVLTDVSLSVRAGESLAVVGPSGAGKSTLLNVLGLLDRPTAGGCRLLGEETTEFTARAINRARARHIGFVFQDAHVLGLRTCRDNVDLALWAASTPANRRRTRIETAIERVGLGHRLHAQAGTLSGGERQRLAIARAIVTSPQLILADEPTGNLDPDNTEVVLDLLLEQCRSGAALIMITHDADAATVCSQRAELRHGALSTVVDRA